MTSVESIPACLLAAVPVAQPPHLEGDPSLATEILPGPPPLHSVQQQSGVPRRDHKKSAAAFSYLPVSDPGTTFSGYMVSPMTTTAEVDGPRRKRARLDEGRTTTGRAQRASARNLPAAEVASDPPPLEAVASSSQIIPDSDPLSLPPDSDGLTMSRSASVVYTEEQPPLISSTRRSYIPRKDKGKERGKEGTVRVKEEPSIVSLGMSEPVMILSNEDHCSSCRSLGALVYCDGCPRAFHLWCLNPPMAQSDLPGGETKWYCPACQIRQKRPPKPQASLKFMAPLIDQVQNTIPTEYQLPQDIRTFFKDVVTGPRGTYVDGSEIKPPRLNRHGQLEDRDPYRLKDRNGEPVLCFRCGTSALPPSTSVTAPAAKRTRHETRSLSSASENGRSIISCDYCHLHWHMDCVDPPLPCMPAWNKKWMCPNHADNISQPKRRIPRANAPPIEIMKPRQYNNGNVEVIQSDTTAQPPTKVAADEVLINGRRYRVPERIITLDFWNKVNKKDVPVDVETEDVDAMSPLTSLSSLEDEDNIPPITRQMDIQKPLFNIEEVMAAQLLCGLQRGLVNSKSILSSSGVVSGKERILTERGAQTEINSSDAQSRESGMRVSNGSTAPGIVIPASISAKLQKVSTPRRAHASTARVLKEYNPSDTGDGSVDSEPTPPLKIRRPRRKAEPKSLALVDNAAEIRVPIPIVNGSADHTSEAHMPSKSEEVHAGPSLSSASTRPRRTRRPSRAKLEPEASTASWDGIDNVQDSTPAVTPVPSQPSSTLVSKPKPSGSTARRKPAHFKDTPQKSTPIIPEKKMTMSSPPIVPIPAAKTESNTTTLKIRLPRLDSLNLTSSSVAPNTGNSHASSSRSKSRTRPRRNGTRERASTSTSMNGTPSSFGGTSSSHFMRATSPMQEA